MNCLRSLHSHWLKKLLQLVANHGQPKAFADNQKCLPVCPWDNHYLKKNRTLIIRLSVNFSCARCHTPLHALTNNLMINYHHTLRYLAYRHAKYLVLVSLVPWPKAHKTQNLISHHNTPTRLVLQTPVFFFFFSESFLNVF